MVKPDAMASPPKRASSRRSMENGSKDAGTPTQAKDPLTILSEVACKEVIDTVNSHGSANHQPNQVKIEDVVTGFRKLGKDMTTSQKLSGCFRVHHAEMYRYEWLMVASDPFSSLVLTTPHSSSATHPPPPPSAFRPPPLNVGGCVETGGKLCLQSSIIKRDSKDSRMNKPNLERKQ